MKCPNCQSDIFEGAKFCTACGTPITEMPAENVVEEVKAVEETVEENVADVPAIENELPDASFDPGAPIAVPKQEEEPVITDEVPEIVPEIAPVESVAPEFPQTHIENAAPAFTPAPAPTPVVAPAPVPVVAPAPAPMPSPVLTPSSVPTPVASSVPTMAGQNVTDTNTELKPMSTGTAFWLQLLFAIPVIGFIAAVISSFAGSKCKSRKNFAKSVVIWKILRLIIVLALIIVVYFLIRDAFDAAMSGDVEEFIECIKDYFGL